jgi:hypothetical protein
MEQFMPIKIDNPKENSDVIEIDLPKKDTIIFKCSQKKYAEELESDIVALKKIYKTSRAADFKHSLEANKLIIKMEGNLDHAKEFLEHSGLLSNDICQKLAQAIKNINIVATAQAVPSPKVLTNAGVGIFSNNNHSLSTTDSNRDSLSTEENNLALQIENEIVQKLTNVSQPVKNKILSDLIKICAPMQSQLLK